MHRINTKGCINYDDYQANIALRGPVKNSPFQNHMEDACLF